MKEKIFETTQLINTNTHTQIYKHETLIELIPKWKLQVFLICTLRLLVVVSSAIQSRHTILTHYSMFTFRLRARIFLPYAISKKCKTKSEQTMIELSFSTVSCNKQHEQRPLYFKRVPTTAFQGMHEILIMSHRWIWQFGQSLLRLARKFRA